MHAGRACRWRRRIAETSWRPPTSCRQVTRVHPQHRASPLRSLALVERSTVARRLGLAISNLIVDEWRLLAMDARMSERAVAFALGWHLRQVMERSWDIDCEYNRVFHGVEAIVKRPHPPAADDPHWQTVT